jgi:hypothetical protein
MTDVGRMSVQELVGKVLADEHADVLRQAVVWLAQELMEVEAAAAAGAGYGERSGERTARRNGYRSGHGRPGSARWSWPFPGCGRGRTSRASWSPGGCWVRPSPTWRRGCPRSPGCWRPKRTYWPSTPSPRLLEQNDEWLVSRRYLSEASMAELTIDPTPTTGEELQVAEAHRRR